jgi:NADP-dependent 3-hydroxy acid dehydrogenase YdfG
MSNHLEGKSIIITGAASGFGRLTAEKAAAAGARLTCVDINKDAVERVAAEIRAAGGAAQAAAADVAQIGDMRAAAKAALDAYGAIDVMVNNAGVMPLAFLSDHEAAYEAWNRCIEINLKGVLNGIVATYDQMIAQGRGHVVNVSSIYGNRAVVGSAVYGATKAAVDYLTHSLRQEGRGKIKVTLIKPSGVRATGLGATVVNGRAAAGIVGHNVNDFYQSIEQMRSGSAPPEWDQPDHIEYGALGAEYIADAILHAVNQPWGVAISDMTVRAAGDFYLL